MELFTDAAGWIGSALLLICSIPQAWRSVKHGHSRGLSILTQWLWMGGMLFMLIYLVPRGIWPVVISHLVNIFVAGTIIWYYYFPRKF